MQHTAHDSKAFRSAGYENGVMEVTYHSGKTYAHPGVPQETYDAFLASGSKGKFLNEHIKAQHPGSPKA